MNKSAPCKHCPSRERNCHANCRDYHDWKRRHNEIKDILYQQKRREEDVYLVTKGRGRDQ
jgi:hypothetical protein